MSKLAIDLKRQEVEDALDELDRLLRAAEEAYEQAVAIEEWEESDE